MQVISNLADLQRMARERGLDSGLGGIFVPTMGALHEGHAALVRHARRLASERARREDVVVSIFVNPTQFNDPKDLQRYPRTLEADLRLCEAAGASIVFAPGVEDIYPPAAPPPVPPLPSVATDPRLEDAHRPGHFAGVCQVVKRLFDLVAPAVAIFGEKDWQQLAVIRAMTTQLGLGVEILGHPTIREPGGLAMSSRNVFLSAGEREAALTISAALRAACRAETAGSATLLMHRMLERAGLQVEYATIRDAATLLPIAHTVPSTRSTRPRRTLIAVRLGKVRLIDNADWPGGW